MQIICPNCEKIQNAEIQNTVPHKTFIHNCECGYTIMESEWQEAKEANNSKELEATTEKMAELCFCSTGEISKLCQAGASGEKTGFIGAKKNGRRWVIPQHYFDFIEKLDSKGNVRLSIRLYNIQREKNNNQ